MYSQLNEDDVILDYFKDFKGTILDIGANDGITLSNSRWLIQRGWKADLIEPAAIPYRKLRKLYENTPDVKVHDFAIDNKSGLCKLYESISLYSTKDSGLLSTIRKDNVFTGLVQMTTGEQYSTKFTEYEIEALSFKDFQEKALYKTWDFITIDTEGCDWDILQQMNLSELGCQCLCIEHNSQTTEKVIAYCKQYNMVVSYLNEINIILVKQ